MQQTPGTAGSYQSSGSPTSPLSPPVMHCDSPQDHMHTNGHLHSPPMVNGGVPQGGILRDLQHLDQEAYRINGFKQEPGSLEAEVPPY